MCEDCARLCAELIELAAIVRGHLVEAEELADYIAFGPEPSDRINDIIHRLGGSA